MASKIEQELTPAQVVDMLATLANTPGGDVLRVIKAEAERRGISISLMAASSFRDSALAPYLEKLKNSRLKGQALAEAVTAGDETGFLASSRTTLAEKISDFLMEEEGEARAERLKEIAVLSKALQSLTNASSGDRLTVARLREFEAREEERKQKAQELERRKRALVEKGGLSEEAVALMEEALKIHAGA